jgi:hypothetical protein
LQVRLQLLDVPHQFRVCDLVRRDVPELEVRRTELPVGGEFALRFPVKKEQQSGGVNLGERPRLRVRRFAAPHGCVALCASGLGPCPKPGAEQLELICGGRGGGQFGRVRPRTDPMRSGQVQFEPPQQVRLSHARRPHNPDHARPGQSIQDGPFIHSVAGLAAGQVHALVDRDERCVGRGRHERRHGLGGGPEVEQ